MDDGLGIDTWDMFYGCRNLLRIHTPGGGYVPYIELPAVYTGSDGLTYTTMPVDKGESITLTWTAAIDDQIRPVEKDIVIYSGPESVSVRADTQYQGVSSTKWNNFANASSSSMTKTVQESWNGWKVRCVVTDASGNRKESGAALITIAANPISIISQPASVTTPAKKNVTFTVEAQSSLGETLSYQWQYQGVSSTKWNNFTNATSPSMTKTAQGSWNGWKVRCVITDGAGNTVNSASAKITVE